MSYGDLLEDLSSAWRKADAPDDPATDDGFWIHTLKTVFEELELLGLSKPVPQPEPKKRGRPPKAFTEEKQTSKMPTEDKQTQKVLTEDRPKRPRGRPQKMPAEDKPKKPRGRPKKNF